MCEKVNGQPIELILDRYQTKNGTWIETYTFSLGKVTSLTNGEHKSGRGFAYPVGQTVSDPNAMVGNHSTALHFIANPVTDKLESYGSHPLVVLPAPQLWDPPVENGKQPSRCWHSNGCSILFCITCAGLKPDDLTNPDFWQDITKPRKRTATRKTTKKDEFVLRLPRNSVWHKERMASTK
jgi:hypothetical protein